MKLPGVGILNSKGYVYDDVVDFDEASEYPRVILTFNISKNSIFGRVKKITKKLSDGSEKEFDYKDVNEFNKLLQTRKTSIFEIMETYYGLPSVDKILSDIEGGYNKMRDKKCE